jgi:hypothetical protein
MMSLTCRSTFLYGFDRKDSEKDMSKVYPVITVLRCLLTKSIHHLESHAEVGTIKSTVSTFLDKVRPKYSGTPE